MNGSMACPAGQWAMPGNRGQQPCTCLLQMPSRMDVYEFSMKSMGGQYETSSFIKETMFTHITDQLYIFQDTCNVYVLCSGHEAVLIDFGSGDVLDHLVEIGVERVTDVLITHHHRDQGQGLARAF